MKVFGWLHAPIASTLEGKAPVPSGQEDVWAPEPAWILWRRAIILALTGIEPQPSNPQLNILTELSWL
jgi:hypothetical protein